MTYKEHQKLIFRTYVSPIRDTGTPIQVHRYFDTASFKKQGYIGYNIYKYLLIII